MRILHVCSEYPPQQVFGLGRYVCGLSRELVKQGHTVHVLTNSMGGKDSDAVDLGVEVHRTPFPPPPKPPGNVAPVVAFNLHLQQRAFQLGFGGLGKPETVVSHDWLTVKAGYELAKRYSIPHVWTVHDTVHGKRLGKVTSEDDRFVYSVERWGTQSSNAILVNSHAIGEEIRSIYGAKPEKVRLLHCGIDTEHFDLKQEPSRLMAFRSVFAGTDDLLITFVGRLDPEKGIDTLIDAFASVVKRIPNVRLAIAGRGALQSAIESQVHKLGLQDRVRHYGYLKGDVLKHFYLISDIHVCPSRYEPFGLVVGEAMAAGRAVVASDTGGLRDIISNSKVGKLVPPNNVQALGQMLLELATSDKVRRDLGRAAARHVRKLFTWTEISRQASKLYSEAIAIAD